MHTRTPAYLHAYKRAYTDANLYQTLSSKHEAPSFLLPLCRALALRPRERSRVCSVFSGCVRQPCLTPSVVQRKGSVA